MWVSHACSKSRQQNTAKTKQNNKEAAWLCGENTQLGFNRLWIQIPIQAVTFFPSLRLLLRVLAILIYIILIVCVFPCHWLLARSSLMERRTWDL